MRFNRVATAILWVLVLGLSIALLYLIVVIFMGLLED